MSVKLRDVARRAGVHPSTVSRVLNGVAATSRLSQATRERILAVAAETGYRPNRLARSLKKRRTNILGMLIPDIANPFFASAFRAVEDVAGRAGYNVILCNTDDNPVRFEQHLRVLSEGHVDGLLITAAHLGDSSIGDLRARGIPYVLMNRHRDDPSDSWVVSDSRHGADLAVEHLQALGHRRIAHMAGALDVSTAVARLEGFRAAVAARGLRFDEALIVDGGLTEASGALGMRRLLALPPHEQPTAVFASNDLAALGAIAAARAAGLGVPDDLSVVGYSDTPLPGYAGLGLTTLHVPIDEMGRLAAEALIRRLDGPSGADEPPVQIVLPVELVARGSTAPAPAEEALFR